MHIVVSRLHWTICVSVPVAFQFRCQVSKTAIREDGFVSSGRVTINKKKGWHSLEFLGAVSFSE